MREPGARAYVLGRDRWVAALVVGLAYLAGAFFGYALSTPNAPRLVRFTGACTSMILPARVSSTARL